MGNDQIRDYMIFCGVDTGGTFTDFIYRTDTGWAVHKCLSTPKNPAKAVIEGLRTIAKGKKVHLVHGSTVATNTVLEQKGARTALIVNQGFEDIIAIGRQNRHKLYQLSPAFRPVLIPSAYRFGISGRINYKGEILEKIDQQELIQLRDRLAKMEVEAIAVCLLFAFANPGHEQQVRKALAPLEKPISLSHEILSEFREFERMSTTVVNAYVLPKMSAYLTHIADDGGGRRFRIMQSNGGSIAYTTAAREPVRTILSGPAGGVVGAFEIGKRLNRKRLITFDMGGTSTDVALIDHRLPLTTEASIGDFPVKVPMIDIHTVGAGGGSIARLDAGGALCVGPQSAGADPGPVCFGKGDMITVTDANLLLGRLLPDYFLGGHLSLSQERLISFFDALVRTTGMTRMEVAQGIIDIANTKMEHAIRVISVEKGFDPMEFTLFSFGGAGGMHACFLARLLNIPQIIIPRHPGILSAQGMLLADIVKDYAQTVFITAKNGDLKELNPYFDVLAAKGISDLMAEGIPKEEIKILKFADMRYKGQSFEIMVPYRTDGIQAFHAAHEKHYGYCHREKPVEIVTLRVRAAGTHDAPFHDPAFKNEFPLKKEVALDRRPVWFDGEWVETPVYAREKLPAGCEFRGPALLVEYSSTIVLPPFAKGRIDTFGHLRVALGD